MAVSAAQIFIPSVILLVIFLISSGLYAASWGIVPPSKVGLNFDTTTRNFDKTTIYPPGRYFIWMHHTFEHFDITYRIIDFSSDLDPLGGPTLAAIASGGQPVNLDVSFYYRIDETKVISIFEQTRTNLNELLITQAQNTLKIIASRFDISEYYEKRREISATMLIELNADLYSKYFVWVPLLQLRNIGLPSSVANSRIDVIVASQNAKTEQLNREIVLVKQETEFLRQEYAANTTLVLNEANALSFAIEQNAIAEGQRIYAEAEASARNNFTVNVGFNSTSQLMTYLFTKYLKDASSSDSFIVGFDGAVPIILG
jgi:uncharacterized membrane protein YqiK